MKQGVDNIGVSVGAMVFDDEERLFLAKRSKNCKNEREHWEAPGGSVEFNESLEDAVKREFLEEYGVELEIVEQWPASDHFIPADKQHWVATSFLAKTKNGQKPKILEPEKCDEIGWFPIKKLPHPLSIITKKALVQYKQLQKAER